MYEALKFIFVGIIILLGGFMAVCPKYAVKEEQREDETSLAGTRKKGIALAAVGIMASVVLVMVQMQM